MANADNPWKYRKYYVASVHLNLIEIPHNLLLFLPISDIQSQTPNTPYFR